MTCCAADISNCLLFNEFYLKRGFTIKGKVLVPDFPF